MTERQKRICEKHRQRQADGFVRCNECPLVVDKYRLMCRANIRYNRKTREWEINSVLQDNRGLMEGEG